MSRLKGTLARLRLLFARRAAESRMDDEFRFHMQMETEKNIRAGMSPEEARRRAAVAFGGVEEHKEAMRDDRGLAWLGGWSLDVKLGVRMLAKYPGLAIVGGLGMALATAIGAGAYAVSNVYFYPELPLHEGERVVAIINFDPRLRNDDKRVLHDFVTWRRELRSIVDLGAFRTIRRNLVTGAGHSEPVTIAEMTASGFRVARVPPLLGRTLLDADECPGPPPVVVIGHDVWESRFGRDSAVVGRAVRLGRTAYGIVGVMPAGFGFPISHSYWVPLRVDLTAHAPGTGPELEVFGRLAPGATKDQARAELAVIRRRLAAERPATGTQLQPLVVPYTDIFAEGEGQSDPLELVIMQLVITLLLVLVCLNVAVLVYARTVTRTGEIALRTALGATRGRVVTQLFAEAFVLSVLAAVVGLGLVVIGLRHFDRVVAFISDTGRAPFWIDAGLSIGTVLYALALALLAAVIVGVLPALRATGAQLRAAMVSLGGAKAQLGRTWTFLIVAQIAMAVVALPPALLWETDVIKQVMQKPGFAAHEVLGARFVIEGEGDLSASAARTGPERAARARATQTELITRLAAEPGVVGVTVATGMPGGEHIAYLEVNGADSSVQVRAGQVEASYFDLFGVRVAAGRKFSPADAALATEHRPVVVNRSFVTEMLGGGSAVGRRVRYQSKGDDPRPWLEIVGVIEDFPPGYKNPQETAARVYHLAAPGEMLGGVLMVRLRGQAPAAFVQTLHRVASSLDPTLQLIRVSPLDVMYADRGRVMGLLALVIALVTGSVLLLSAAGIHALMSFTINQRRREIGVRAALGADARRILTGVLSRASSQLALGVAIGLFISLVLERYSQGEMMGGRVMVFVPGIAAFMVVVGLLAAAGPARRGLRVQPTEALRGE
jgi:putative ABC transport system permease protein